MQEIIISFVIVSTLCILGVLLSVGLNRNVYKENRIMKQKIVKMEELLIAKQKQLIHAREKVNGCVVLRKDQYRQLVYGKE